jgi:exopolyphosphatase/guanosine-5'-triphosphate,3'-diphosphate pyrophosphatase
VTTTIAAIDVGTNSVHMVIARVGQSGFTVLAAEKEVVRLGEGAKGMDHLTFAAIERGVNAMRHMKRIADAHSAAVRAVATSAVREAENRDDFIDAVRQTVGINVEVISGSEEARLIHLGVSRSLNLTKDSVLTVDIGGGSTEFCLSVRGNLRFAQSLKMGAVRMTDSFLPDGMVTDGGVKKLRSKVQSALAPMAHDIARLGWDRIVLSSGTNETIARMVAAARGTDAPLTFNGYQFEAGELNSVVKTVLDHRTPGERIDLEGLDPKRADIIAAGAVILQEISRMLHATSFEYSEYALREGVLVDTAQRLGVMAADTVDAGQASAMRLAERCSVDIAHGSHVADLGARILKAVGRHYEVDPSLERLLRAAGLLARAGNAVAYSKYHLHSYYIIRNADLMGFTDDEINVIALAARYHRKGMPKTSHEEFGKLSKDRQHDVELIAGILRIASGLDRSHDQCVREMSSSSKDGTFTLSVRHSCASGELTELNIFTAQSRVEMLEQYLGDRIIIKDGGQVRR